MARLPARQRSVKMLTFAMPSRMVLRKSSSDRPEPPWRTRGVSTAARISFRRPISSLGLDLYAPCAVPMATASASTPVRAMKSAASSGVV